jgi:hypothetical protein
MPYFYMGECTGYIVFSVARGIFFGTIGHKDLQLVVKFFKNYSISLITVIVRARGMCEG